MDRKERERERILNLAIKKGLVNSRYSSKGKENAPYVTAQDYIKALNMTCHDFLEELEKATELLHAAEADIYNRDKN